jgi:hypothetical protein
MRNLFLKCGAFVPFHFGAAGNMYDSPAQVDKEVRDFSIVRGGPFFRLLCSSRLCDDHFHYTFRRITVISLAAWLPLLILSVMGDHAAAGIQIPFIDDIETHVRFLIALPLLLIGESWAQSMLTQSMERFVVRNIVRKKDLARFDGFIKSVYRMRDSIAIEALIFIIVIAVGRLPFASIASASVDSHTWYASPDGVHWNLTYAGYWMAFVSLPIFQFLLLRWYFRLVIWLTLLFRVSRLDLNLIATHSDRTGGIGFLSKTVYAFSFFLIAQGALLSGYIAGQALNKGTNPLDLKVEAAVLVALLIAAVLAPQLAFINKLRRAKWYGAGIYGTLVSNYVEGFDEKWINNKYRAGQELLGTSDIQSLADITNSYAVISQMRLVPFTLNDAIYLVVFTVGPLVPLVLFVFSPEQVLEKLFNILL